MFCTQFIKTILGIFWLWGTHSGCCRLLKMHKYHDSTKKKTHFLDYFFLYAPRNSQHDVTLVKTLAYMVTSPLMMKKAVVYVLGIGTLLRWSKLFCPCAVYRNLKLICILTSIVFWGLHHCIQISVFMKSKFIDIKIQRDINPYGPCFAPNLLRQF